ncbi:MAG: hypothetical protein CBC55_04735 [Gammaproteobacteria bacterium TMED95]|nr:MAG: hypothetical protein CBC55_04735 [Gammaproteobacteria bacterium TMED95]|tara:strand:+ start:4014 stop:5270 length:1257 start_codon:yes stop_codon:yes gene_type:complete
MTTINEDKMLYFSSREAGPRGYRGVHISYNDMQKTRSGYGQVARVLRDKGLVDSQGLPNKEGTVFTITPKGKLSLIARQVKHARQVKDEALISKREGQLVERVHQHFTPEQLNTVLFVLYSHPSINHSKEVMNDDELQVYSDLLTLGLVRYSKRDKSFTSDMPPNGKRLQKAVLESIDKRFPETTLNRYIEERFISTFEKMPVLEVDIDSSNDKEFANALLEKGLIEKDVEDDSFIFYTLTEAGRVHLDREGATVKFDASKAKKTPGNDTPVDVENALVGVNIPRVFDPSQSLQDYVKQGTSLLIELAGEAVASQINELHWDGMHDMQCSLYEALSDIVDIEKAPAIKTENEREYDAFLLNVIERAKDVFARPPSSSDVEMVAKAILSNEGVVVPEKKLKQVIFDDDHKSVANRPTIR